jgi:hypothetical protein
MFSTAFGRFQEGTQDIGGSEPAISRDPCPFRKEEGRHTGFDCGYYIRKNGTHVEPYALC